MLPPIFWAEVTLITERPLRALVQFLRDTNASKVFPSIHNQISVLKTGKLVTKVCDEVNR